MTRASIFSKTTTLDNTNTCSLWSIMNKYKTFVLVSHIGECRAFKASSIESTPATQSQSRGAHCINKGADIDDGWRDVYRIEWRSSAR